MTMIRHLLSLTLLFAFGLLMVSCNNDDDDDEEGTNALITEQNVRAVFNFLPPNGYSTDGYLESFPDAVTGLYDNDVTDQNVNVSAVANLTGQVIDVTQSTINNSFITATNIQTSTVNGTDVHQAMDGTTYRVVIFRGQWQFEVAVLNDPDPSVGETEAQKFIDLITEAMTTF